VWRTACVCVCPYVCVSIRTWELFVSVYVHESQLCLRFYLEVFNLLFMKSFSLCAVGVCICQCECVCIHVCV
jgi:hypothetical protein